MTIMRSTCRRSGRTEPRARSIASRLIFLLCVSLSAPAAADEPADPLARALKEKGDEAMVAARYEEALDAYTRAANIEPNPVLDYNRGRALQAIQRYGAALDALERFQRTATPELFARVPRFEELLASLRARVAELEVVCTVRGAVVRFDGQPLGTAPLARVRVNSGVGLLRVEAPGYEPWQSSVALEPGRSRRVDVVLVRAEPLAALDVTSPVPGAHVALDGVPRGPVPVQLRARPGSHVLRVERDGHEPLQMDVVLREGERRRVDAPLERRSSIFGSWWLWTGIGILAAAGAVTTVVLVSEREPRQGDIAPGKISAPLPLP